VCCGTGVRSTSCCSRSGGISVLLVVGVVVFRCDDVCVCQRAVSY
jgi:hypothetical protein